MLDDNAGNHQLVAVFRHGIGRNEPAIHMEAVRKIVEIEVHLGVFFDLPGYQRQIVAIIDNLKRLHLRELGRQILRDAPGCLMDARVALSAQAQKVVILGHHLATRPREINTECGHITSEIVNMENQLVWQVFLAAPNHPAHARVHQAVFVARNVNGPHQF